MIDHCYSTYLPCDFGVPQGSILGPLIFLIFVNDLAYHLKCPIEQYADDTTLSSSSKDIGILSQELTEDCNTLSNWMAQNSFKLNADKTTVLTLGTQRRLNSLENSVNIYMDGLKLKESGNLSETLLGCQIQGNLKWTQQVIAVKNKLKKRVTGVYNLRNMLPYGTLKIVCEGWFMSVLAYCLPLYGGCENGSLKDLQIIQNKIARLVTKSHIRTNRSEIYDAMKWLTVQQLIVYHTLLAVFRIRLTGEPEFLASVLLRDNFRGKIIIPMSNLTLYRKSFTYRGICYWNSLPETMRSLNNIVKFKKEVKEWILINVTKF